MMNIPGIKEIFKVVDEEIVNIQLIRDLLVVSTQHRLYFLSFNEELDCFQVIQDIPKENNIIIPDDYTDLWAEFSKVHCGIAWLNSDRYSIAAFSVWLKYGYPLAAAT